MDTKFLSIYNEVAQENFISVVKQNLIFQTQIKMLEDQVRNLGDLQKKIDESSTLQTEYRKLMTENSDLRNQLNSANKIVVNNSKTESEKNRIQSALNDKMREVVTLKQSIENLQQEVHKKTEYIEQMQEMLPITKRKKLGLTVDVKNEETAVDNQNIVEVSSGGSF
jgi:predicted  nucleic acid-binding Zn-ribbon protein